MGVTHTFASVIADDAGDAAAGKVLPSHWNAAHTITGMAVLTANTFTGTQTLGSARDAANPGITIPGGGLIWRANVVEAGTADFGCALTLNAGSNGETRQDNQFGWGYNYGPNGAAFNSSEHKFFEAIESRYKTGASITQLEHYWGYTNAAGTLSYRPFSQTINLTDDSCETAVRADRVVVGNPNDAYDWLTLTSGTASASMALSRASTIAYGGSVSDFVTAAGNPIFGYDSTNGVRIGYGGVAKALIFGNFNKTDGFLLKFCGNTSAATSLKYDSTDGWQVEYTDGVFRKLGSPFTDAYLAAAESTRMGSGALDSYTTGAYNVAIGTNTLTAVAGASSNVAIGYKAAESNVSGNNVIAIGHYAYRLGTAGSNIAIGTQTMQAVVTGGNNVGIGSSALAVLTSGTGNVAIGTSAGGSVLGGVNNFLLGAEAGVAITSGSENIAIGTSSLHAATTANGNIAIGHLAMNAGVSAGLNVAIGASALRNNTGDNSVAIGPSALTAQTDGYRNIGIGPSALGTVVSGANNVGIGSLVLSSATGSQNIAIGASAGSNQTSGAKNIIIGYNIDGQSNTGSNQITIGNLFMGTGASGTGTTLAGNAGIAVAAPSARLHLPAGAAGASAAPLKFTSGTNQSTAEAGAMEYNGTNLFFTRAGTAREGVLTQSAVTTEAVASDTTVTVNIGGTTYKLLARA